MARGETYISIHSLRVEGDGVCCDPDGDQKISIHSLRVEGDAISTRFKAHICISIHSLRVEGDVFPQYSALVVMRFQSTPSVWRETASSLVNGLVKAFQSTPSVWRETGLTKSCGHRRNISIHSLRVEGDRYDKILRSQAYHFNPLPPCGGRRRYVL